MKKQQYSPRTKPLDASGDFTPEWKRYFQTLSEVYDLVRRPPDLVYAVDATLTSRDWGKIIRFDNDGNDLTCTLMDMTAIDVDCWLTIARTGTGRLTVVPPSDTRIEYGSYGGRMWCDEQRRAAANVTLQFIKLTQLAIVGATGVWRVR